MKIIGWFILFLSANANAQNAVIKELRFKPNTKFYNTTANTIVYPVVITKNATINKLINDKIRKEVLGSENADLNISKQIANEINDGLTDLTYEIRFRKNGILSLNTSRQECVGNCNNSNTRLNFDLTTGMQIFITDLLSENKIDSFRNIVFRQKIKLLEKYKQEEKQNITNKQIDDETYKWILSEVDSGCIKTVSITDFSLSAGYIEIIDPCEFPHAIRSQEPDYKLKYSYKNVFDFMKPAWLRRLSK